MKLPYNLILGSASPRRKELLQAMGFTFTVMPSAMEEHHPPNLAGAEIAEFIAVEKARSLKKRIEDKDLILTADTIVCLNNKVLHKPKSENEAREMLKLLSGEWHEVITAVCLANTKEEVVFHAVTQVLFSKLTNLEVEYYVNSFKPLDKAGAYGIQEWIGLIGVARIEGSYTNVVGLPTHLVYKRLMYMAE